MSMITIDNASNNGTMCKEIEAELHALDVSFHHEENRVRWGNVLINVITVYSLLWSVKVPSSCNQYCRSNWPQVRHSNTRWWNSPRKLGCKPWLNRRKQPASTRQHSLPCRLAQRCYLSCSALCECRKGIGATTRTFFRDHQGRECNWRLGRT